MPAVAYDVASVALPLVSADVPRVLFPCMNVTEPPVVAPYCPVTFAVKVIDWFKDAGLWLEVNAVVVFAGFTVCVSVAELAAKFVSPV